MEPNPGVVFWWYGELVMLLREYDVYGTWLALTATASTTTFGIDGLRYLLSNSENLVA